MAHDEVMRGIYLKVSVGEKRRVLGAREVFVNRELYQQGFADIMRYPPDVKRCDEIKRE